MAAARGGQAGYRSDARSAGQTMNFHIDWSKAIEVRRAESGAGRARAGARKTLHVMGNR
jgi:hypothetical protein